jgi:thiol-disulfide isomerase/thioredoxin
MPLGLRATDLEQAFAAAMSWSEYLASAPDHADAWKRSYDGIDLTTAQEAMLRNFTRDMPVLIVSGSWCGDCVRQGPIAQIIMDAAPSIDLRFIDRDHAMSPIDHLQINAGARVPVTVFMAEDFQPVSVFGDRTLHYYRHMAAERIGAACPLPGAGLPADVLAATVQDWVDEFERVHLLLRLSGRLRQRHED